VKKSIFEICITFWGLGNKTENDFSPLPSRSKASRGRYRYYLFSRRQRLAVHKISRAFLLCYESVQFLTPANQMAAVSPYNADVTACLSLQDCCGLVAVAGYQTACTPRLPCCSDRFSNYMTKYRLIE
jgi:hypothetical protein